MCFGGTLTLHAKLHPGDELLASVSRSSEGLSLKPDGSNCSAAIIPPSSVSITCHLSRQRADYAGLFFMHVRILTHTQPTHTHVRMDAPAHTDDDTIVLWVARCYCNLRLDRVAGLAVHQ